MQVKKLLSGLLFTIIGLVGMVLSSKYSIGSLYMMGPGLFPLMVSVGIIICGILLAVESYFDAR
jgi:hypothetical protein